MKRRLFSWAAVPMLAASLASAGAWRAGSGSTYAELNASSISASRVSTGSNLDGVETLKTTNSSLRLYSEVYLTSGLALVLNTPVLDHHRFGDAAGTRFGDLGLGLRQTLKSTEGWALAASLAVQAPTVAKERRLGEVYENDKGQLSFANDATGSLEVLPSLLFSTRRGKAWIDASAGYAARSDYADQLVAGAQVYRPIYRRLAGSFGVHARVNLQEARPRQDGARLANGVGESGEFAGWYARADWRFPNGLGLGGGIDGGFWLKDYPLAPGVTARVSFAGKLW